MTWSRGRRPNISLVAAFWSRCSCGLTHFGKPTRMQLQWSNLLMVNAWTSCFSTYWLTYLRTSGRHTNRKHSKSSNLCQACIKDYYITASHINRSEGAQLSHQYISFGSIQHTGNLYNSTFVNSRHHCQLRSFRYDEQFLWIIRTAFCCWHRFWKFLNARQE